MFSSVIGMVDPNGGLVITTSAERSGIALAADFTLARWPFGDSREFKWREVLAAIPPQVRADDLLVGRPLGVHVDAGELVLRRLRDHEGEGAIREADLLAALEDGPVLLLHLGEERRDAFSDLLDDAGAGPAPPPSAGDRMLLHDPFAAASPRQGISPASATITPRRRFPNTGTSSPAKEGGMTFHLHDYSRPSESAYLMIPMTPPVGSRMIAMRPTAGMSVGPASTTPPASGTLAAHASTSSTVT